MENELVRLRIAGITYNQIENGMYAMVLEEVDGSRRLPIIIGYSEAQSIECMLQNIQTPRPLTHEFASEILGAFDIRIDSVVIRQLENGIFAADVTLRKGEESSVIDARSSDAIALAMRVDAPVFTSRELMDKCGVERDSFGSRAMRIASRQSIPARKAVERVRRSDASPLAGEDMEALISMMEEAVAEEDYERAGEIKMEIEKRRNGAGKS